ncbi:DUF551 domain-containing protein [Cronobacter sakazakii]|uniref:DUF551 domain-containing protein n=1 Tax=Cronobacter sakazakii TaxID=28141 RepID=UPI000A1977CF|nr:DUF551 domain-containing protein [Cronobacter sakazakii]
MSEISEEALAAACAEKVKQLEFSVKQSALDSVRQELETELAIARVALAALRERAEPVAYMIGGHYLMHANDPKVDNYSSAVPLYTAPPAPVVTAETFEEWSRRCEIQLTLCRPEFREVAEITWNACRAAMLAAPPAPVTAGWIACSERMPEVGDIVLTADNGGVNVGEMEHSGASYRYFTSVVSGRELPATHWMPLPEAPTKN